MATVLASGASKAIDVALTEALERREDVVIVMDLTNETHPADPMISYGAFRFSHEKLAKSYIGLYGAECVNLRTSVVYAPELTRRQEPIYSTPRRIVEACTFLVEPTR